VLERISELRRQAEDEISSAADLDALEELRVRHLGRKAELTTILRGIGDLPPEQRGPAGAAGNEARQALEALLASRRDELELSGLDERLAADAIDVTLPGSPVAAAGSRNLLIRTLREIEDVFVGLGYRVMEGPEVELDFYNFTALNHPPGHPARMAQDTFYVDPASLSTDLRIAADPAAAGREDEEAGGDLLPPGPEDVVLRTHTSPMQVRAMESQKPPVFIVIPGRCYRSDPFDATHSPMFHQVEGLAVVERGHDGSGITLADLKGTLLHLMRALFGEEREVRFRTHYFPFTEPSMEPDVSCFLCEGKGCRTCKYSGWIEMGGSGVVDPAVLEFVGYDPEEVSGFAFGWGLERIAQLRHEVPDIRELWGGDLRVIRQF
jgi:phenylalanyl-tRNA synthetase alpha chain